MGFPCQGLQMSYRLKIKKLSISELLRTEALPVGFSAMHTFVGKCGQDKLFSQPDSAHQLLRGHSRAAVDGNTERKPGIILPSLPSNVKISLAHDGRIIGRKGGRTGKDSQD